MALKGTRGITVFDNEEYLSLDKLQATLTKEHTHEDGTFTLCFWMYLMKSNRHGIIIRQSNSNAKNGSPLPFLTIDADLRLALHPLPPSSHDNPSSLETVVVVSDQSSPVEKWVHLGCEVGHSIARLHIDGVVTGEKSICFPSHEDDLGPVVLYGGDGCNNSSSVQAYAHHVCALPQPSVTNHYVKNPPLELSLDGSTGGSDDHEVEEGGDGVWSVVGGKASCRRNFALDVVLLDALGRSVHKDIELVASLVYADTGAPVEKPKDDAEAPLLTTFDGVEFPSTDRPIKLVHGRASFKLKISQLSSKCDNRLFRVCFESPNIPKYPFLRVFSRPIRCVSRNRNSRTPSAPWKRSLAAVYPLDGTVSPGREDKAETSRVNECNGTNVITASKFVTPSKVPRIGDEKISSKFQPSIDKTPERTGNVQVLSKGDVLVAAVSGQRTVHPPVALPCTWAAPQMHKTFKHEEKQQGPESGKVFSAIKTGGEKAFPDFLVFKYCLETIHSRAAFLRSVVPSTSEEELKDLAARVSQCTGCHHNGYQILIAKKLLQDGEEVWKQVSKDGHSVPWNNLLSKLEESFCSVSGRSKRRFTEKDGEFLQRISGGGESISLEQFDRLWQWIYPVAMTVASPQIRKTWETDHPKWIEGMISRKESEELLRSVDGLPKPGTFILRFASSRFWPHPDAGALVISYVGQDLRINHRLLNIDNRLCTNGEIDDTKPLSELLLSQQELCRPLSVQHD